MLQVSVVDASAEDRLRTLQWLQQSFDAQVDGIEFTPRVNFRPVSISELKFQASPDIIIIGPVFAAGPSDDLHHIKKSAANIPIIVIAPNAQMPLATVEYLSRIGIDEILSREIVPQELIKRFVMIASKVRRLASGQLIVVESAKGGVGATSLVAGLGELFADTGKRTLVVDMDSEHQALSRFLQARPFLNEPLQSILDSHRPIASDFVEQCVVQVWKDLPNLFCMPPCSDGVLEGALSTQLSRILIGLFEVLDTTFDVVVVDVGHVRGTMRRILHRAADTVLFVTESDPASVYASFEKVKRIREEISPQARFRIIENHIHARSSGISRADLQREFERVGGVESSEWVRSTIPFCSRALRWPASGLTIYSAGGRKLQRAFKDLADELNGVLSSSHLFAGLVERLKLIRLWLTEKRLASKGLTKSNARGSDLVTAIGSQKVEKILSGDGAIRQIGWQVSSGKGAATIDNFVTPPQ